MQIRSRSFVLQSSMLQQLLTTQRTIHSSTGSYSITIQPLAVKRAGDLWRMNSAHDYVKGEEMLIGWTPRGISLIQDFMKSQKQKSRIAEVETARSVLSLWALEPPEPPEDTDLSQQQKELLEKFLRIWLTKRSEDKMLTPHNLEPPSNGAAFAEAPVSKPRLLGSVRAVPKHSNCSKSGNLMCPDASGTRWVRRFVELRRPYLHVYSTEGDEVLAINLSNSRIDHEPRLTLAAGTQPEGVFAVFAPMNSFLFRARSERDKVEWILRMDESYFSSASGSSSSVGGDVD